MAQLISDRRDMDFVLYEQLQIESLFKTKKFNDLNRKMKFNDLNRKMKTEPIPYPETKYLLPAATRT
jgi:hypothetical protein